MSDTQYTWRPEGSTEENGSTTLDFSAYFLDNTCGKIKFTLSDVSTNPGYCTNAGADDGYDLKFLQSDNGDENTNPHLIVSANGLEATSTPGSYTSEYQIVVTLRCYDYGAHGRITAEGFITENGNDISCGKAVVTFNSHPRNSANKKDNESRGFARIPFDEDEDNMADSWEASFATDEGIVKDINKDIPASFDGDYAFDDSNIMDDEDIHDNSIHDNIHTSTGDGITAFDEYRGFMVNNSWVSTNPICKDLFINWHTAVSNYKTKYDSVSGVDKLKDFGYLIHEISANEHEVRIITKNTEGAGGSQQKCILIRDSYYFDAEDIEGICAWNAVGHTQLPKETPSHGIPMVNGWIFINTSVLPDSSNAYRIANIINHEIGHSLYLHHYQYGLPACIMSTDGDDTPYCWLSSLQSFYYPTDSYKSEEETKIK